MAYCHVLGKDEHSILIGPFIIEQLLTSEIMFWFQFFFLFKKEVKITGLCIIVMHTSIFIKVDA